MAHLIKRNGTWHLKRRVPKRYRIVETRSEIWRSLHTDSELEARTKAALVWQRLEQLWQARLDGNSDDQLERFKAAVDLASSKGFAYLPVEKVKNLPIDSLLDRIEQIEGHQSAPRLTDAQALLGTLGAPAITLSEALQQFWELSGDRVAGKSKDQIRRWRNPYKKAIRNAVFVMGDKPIAAISRDDMLRFRAWWINKIEQDGLTANSAN